MNSRWSDFLRERGARIDGGVVADFGDAAAERRAARDAGVLADLSHLAVLEFAGDDAQAFLHGQLTSDVKALAEGSGTLGAYCSPKGRMLADFLLARAGGVYLMALPRALAEPVAKRLRMFVLRSKVTVTDAGERWIVLGAAGPQSSAALTRVPPIEPRASFEVPQGRSILVVPADRAAEAWQALSASLTPVGTPCWQWLDIRHGVPMITGATQDQLVPQMANLELIGGVSFTKGCYPGQEIVARAQYRGKVKRRMYLARVDDAAAPRAGDALYSDELGDQASGVVVDAQPSPEGGFDVLAVAQRPQSDAARVRLRAPDGPALRFEPLPYEVP